ncbi:MAG: hypothetical protein Q9170_005318 [Blastenia crenularia]
MEKAPQHTENVAPSSEERDEQVLARLGKKSVLKRRFGFWSICGFTCTILVTWEGSLILFINGLNNGGSAGLIYGYLFVWLGTIAVFTTMAELASMAPTTGGQYHWIAQLAPASIRTFMSYIMGTKPSIISCYTAKTNNGRLDRNMWLDGHIGWERLSMRVGSCPIAPVLATGGRDQNV